MSATPGLAHLAADLRRTVAEPEPPFGLYVIESDDPAAALARDVEQRVFLEVFGNTAELLAAEYDAYEAASTFLCVVDHGRETAAGMIRMINDSPAGFKSLVDIERGWGEDPAEVLRRTGLDMDPAQVLDVATLAVAPEYRGDATSGLVSLALYHGVCMLGVERHARWLVTILDVIVLDLIQTRTQRPFSPYQGVSPVRYLDSPSSLPVYSDQDDYRERLAFLDPAMFGILFEGRGIEAALATPWSPAAPPATRRAVS